MIFRHREQKTMSSPEGIWGCITKELLYNIPWSANDVLEYPTLGFTDPCTGPAVARRALPVQSSPRWPSWWWPPTWAISTPSPKSRSLMLWDSMSFLWALSLMMNLTLLWIQGLGQALYARNSNIKISWCNLSLNLARTMSQRRSCERRRKLYEIVLEWNKSSHVQNHYWGCDA